MAEKIFPQSFDYKVLYIFEITDNKNYKGLIKIGDATIHTDLTPDRLPPNCRELNQAALKRIHSYTDTAGLSPKLLHTELAIRTVKNSDDTATLKAFRDYEIHRILNNSGIKHVQLGNSKEWFKLDLSTALNAVKAVKMGAQNLSGIESSTFTPIVFRPEQLDAITKTCRQFKKGTRMLWNAKMRFGKTVCALEVVKKMSFTKTIILTHRPVVNEGWYEDFGKIFHNSPNYIYGSKANGYSVEQLKHSGKKFIYFASIQDLRGSTCVGGKFDKNDDVFKTNWDFVIVDEAHEGTQTTLGDDVIKHIIKEEEPYETKYLALSGTPFNILDLYDDDSIYTWDYIMEQQSKNEWDLNHFGDSNPYDELPTLRIYTYNLGNIVPQEQGYISFEDKAFNFKEFFRTWTGCFEQDFVDMPSTANLGDFIHEKDIVSFLNLMTKEDSKSCYPFSNEEYRNLFRHTLWMVPGIKEAKALKELMLRHPVFGNGAFNIINVAGNGDEEDENALTSVKKAIKEADKLQEYTITLSCGKLTTGVTVREWTAVFMLSGSSSTSTANYLQTIFRVQSPCKSNDGKIKDVSYVFDFAPDRTLKMVTSAVSVSAKAGKTSLSDKQALGKFLNYCPVIGINGSEMKKYNTANLLQELKKAYAERVVLSGFDDSKLYSEELLKLDKIEIEKFNNLEGIIGSTKAAEKTDEIDINHQGLTNEEYEEKEKLEKKPKKKLSNEEKKRLQELKEKRTLRNNAISILRGISIRMPLMIYGADVPYDEDISLNKFVSLVDDASWKEFMPNGVTKSLFKDFVKYYDEEIFIAAGRRIRSISREADTLEPAERVKKISGLFSYFKNPDKETVLTPWRVVNMHMSDCLGGWDFWDKDHNNLTQTPRYVDRGKVTHDVFGNPHAKVLEMDSKTGLYPLYAAYSFYRTKCTQYKEEQLTKEIRTNIWQSCIDENLFIICKTPMAKAITKRTLVGYSSQNINAHYFDNIIQTMKHKSCFFVEKVQKARYWKQEGKFMKFDAIIGNPPYQNTTQGGSGTGHAAQQATPVYNMYVEQAKKLNPNYISMIIQARWYNGGIGLGKFRENMLKDRHIVSLFDYLNSKECFPTVNIAGGLCYFLWDKSQENDCSVTNIVSGKRDTEVRPLDQFETMFIRSNKAIDIINKVKRKTDSFMSEKVSAIDTFGIPSKEKGHSDYRKGDISLLHSVGSNSQGISYISRSVVKKNIDLIDKYKIKISILVPQNGEVGVKPENGYRSISTPQILPPGQVDTFSYLNIGFFDTLNEAENFRKYMTCKFPRFMMRTTYSSAHISKSNFIFVPSLDFTRSWSDKELYEFFGLSNDESNLIETTMRDM